MQILEHGQDHKRTLLFFPCTAEPVWAFADTIAQLSQSWHIFQVVFDGHQPEYPGDFTSVEQTVDEVISYLKKSGISRLDGAYGCSMASYSFLGSCPAGVNRSGGKAASSIFRLFAAILKDTISRQSNSFRAG